MSLMLTCARSVTLHYQSMNSWSSVIQSGRRAPSPAREHLIALSAKDVP